MNTHADKTQQNKSQSNANEPSQQQTAGESTFQFSDIRPEAIAQRKLQETANNSPRAIQFKAIQEMANNSPQVKQAAQFQAMAHAHTKPPLQKYGIEEALQMKADTVRKKENRTGLPDNLKSGIENLSGVSLDDVKVHRNSDKPAQLNAHAYAQGTDIHLGAGQEKHLPHEAWHVVQQKQGRVQATTQMKGMLNVNDDAGLENEADVMGKKASQLKQKENRGKGTAVNIINTRLSTQFFKVSTDPIQREPFVNVAEIDESETVVYEECIAKFKKYSGRLYKKSTRIEKSSKKILPRYRDHQDIVRQAYWDMFHDEIPDHVMSLLGHEEAFEASGLDVDSFGTIGLGDGEEDEDTITVGKDGFKLSIAGNQLVLSKSKLKLHSEQEKKIDTPSLDYKVVFPAPLGPLAPLALTFSLGFSASTSLSLKLEEDASITSDDENRLDIKGTGDAKAKVAAKAGVGVGVSAGVASVIGEIQAVLSAALSGVIKLNASVQENEDIINGGANAILTIAGSTSAALNGAITLQVAFFSKEFGLTFKEWVLGEAKLEKPIAEVGSANAFIPSKADLGVTDEEQRIIDKIEPQPTKTQEKWLKLLLKDYQKSKDAAESLRAQGLDVEAPDFWEMIDSYDEVQKYQIRNHRLIKVSGTEVMPLLVPDQLSAAIKMLK